MSKFYVEKRIAKNDKAYICLYLDLEYKQMMISFNDGDIAQVLDCSVKSLYSLDVNTPILVGEFVAVKGE